MTKYKGRQKNDIEELLYLCKYVSGLQIDDLPVEVLAVFAGKVGVKCIDILAGIQIEKGDKNVY